MHKLINKKFLPLVIIILGVGIVTTFGISACSGKAVEQFNDANVSGQNKGPAEVINIPDGFSNVATKCDHGNRIYTIMHGDSPYGSVAVVAADPSCPK